MVAIMNESLDGIARSHPILGMLVLVLRTVLVAVGIVFIVIGVVMTPLPIPIGIPLFVLGLIITAAASKTLHRLITNQLRKWPWLWSKIRSAFGDKASSE